MVSKIYHSHPLLADWGDCEIIGIRGAQKRKHSLFSGSENTANPWAPLFLRNPKRWKYPLFRARIDHVVIHLLQFFCRLQKCFLVLLRTLPFLTGNRGCCWLYDGQTILSSLLLFNMAFPFSDRNDTQHTHTPIPKSDKNTDTRMQALRLRRAALTALILAVKNMQLYRLIWLQREPVFCHFSMMIPLFLVKNSFSTYFNA